MSGPRPRYESDEARLKTRPHVKVHLSARNHPRYAEAFSDPETRGVIVGLWLLAGQAHAGRTDDVVTLTWSDLGWLTGRAQRAAALRVLRECCARMGYVMSAHGAREERAGSAHGARVSVHIRNFARKQGFVSAARGVDGGASADSASLRFRTPIPTPKDSSTSEENIHYEDSETSVGERQSRARNPSGVNRPDGALSVVETWKRGLEAAVLYRPSAARWSLSSSRRTLLRALLADRPALGEGVLAAVVHGYWARHQRVDPGFDPQRSFEVDTLLRASKRAKYLDAYDEALARDATPPFLPYEAPPPKSVKQRRQEALEAEIRSGGRSPPTAPAAPVIDADYTREDEP